MLLIFSCCVIPSFSSLPLFVIISGYSLLVTFVVFLFLKLHNFWFNLWLSVLSFLNISFLAFHWFIIPYSFVHNPLHPWLSSFIITISPLSTNVISCPPPFAIASLLPLISLAFYLLNSLFYFIISFLQFFISTFFLLFTYYPWFYFGVFLSVKIHSLCPTSSCLYNYIRKILIISFTGTKRALLLVVMPETVSFCFFLYFFVPIIFVIYILLFRLVSFIYFSDTRLLSTIFISNIF